MSTLALALTNLTGGQVEFRRWNETACWGGLEIDTQEEMFLIVDEASETPPERQLVDELRRVGNWYHKLASDVEQEADLTPVNEAVDIELFAAVCISPGGYATVFEVGSYETCHSWCVDLIRDTEDGWSLVVPVRWSLDLHSLIGHLQRLHLSKPAAAVEEGGQAA